jgi:hypothetical protein
MLACGWLAMGGRVFGLGIRSGPWGQESTRFGVAGPVVSIGGDGARLWRGGGRRIWTLQGW